MPRRRPLPNTACRHLGEPAPRCAHPAALQGLFHRQIASGKESPSRDREGNAEFQGFTIAGADRRWYPAKAQHTRLDGEPCIELSSDLVADPVAARYGWAQWPTGNMVGRERLPLPTFRTDDWPLPVGVSYSKEAQDEAGEKLKESLAAAERRALDRKVRQLQIDLPVLEREVEVATEELAELQADRKMLKEEVDEEDIAEDRKSVV